ncbi:MAG: type IX secretion system membrane protein PorP/SprF [Flavobacteriaceae bacterium]
MKMTLSLVVFLLFTISMIGQRIVFPGQNQLYRHLDDPSFISLNGEYNMTGLLQVSDSDIAQTSQYIAAQLSFFDNVAFGLDYSRHSFDAFRYSQLFFSGRYKLELGNQFHYFNIGGSIGSGKLNEVDTSKDNNINTIYRLGVHYTNFNLTIGGYMTTYPTQIDPLINSTDPLSTTEGFTVYLSYQLALSDYLRLTPSVKYNSYDELDIYEGIASLNYKGKYDLAISYKDDYSINAMLGAKFFDRLKVSYSYESALGAQNFNDVHALGISVDLRAKEADIPEWLANVKRNREKINRLKKVKDKPIVALEVPETTIDTTNVAKTETLEDIEKAELTKYPIMTEDAPSDIVDNRLKPGYYIILGSYKKLENAEKEIQRLRDNGAYARYGKKDVNDDFNYIYVDRYDDRDIAIKRTILKQSEKGFERVWLLRVK